MRVAFSGVYVSGSECIVLTLQLTAQGLGYFPLEESAKKGRMQTLIEPGSGIQTKAFTNTPCLDKALMPCHDDSEANRKSFLIAGLKAAKVTLCIQHTGKLLALARLDIELYLHEKSEQQLLWRTAEAVSTKCCSF